VITCRFCPRSRTSADAMIDHLVFWHNISRPTARGLVHHPDRPVPEWCQPLMDERVSLLRQIPLPEDSVPSDV
jgi:hypothetical protein